MWRLFGKFAELCYFFYGCHGFQKSRFSVCSYCIKFCLYFIDIISWLKVNKIPNVCITIPVGGCVLVKHVFVSIVQVYGPESVFYKLSLQCYEFDNPEYKYKLCPFHSVTQQKFPAPATNIGTRWYTNLCLIH